MAVKIKPLHNRVLVRRADSLSKTKSGLYIPETVQDRPQQGVVEAVSDGVILESGELRPLRVKIGDQVVFGRHSGQEVMIGDQEFLIMKEEDIYGIIES